MSGMLNANDILVLKHADCVDVPRSTRIGLSPESHGVLASSFVIHRRTIRVSTNCERRELAVPPAKRRSLEIILLVDTHLQRFRRTVVLASEDENCGIRDIA